MAELTLGDFDRVDARAAVDLPLNDALGLRLSAGSKQRDGYVDRLLVGDALGEGEPPVVWRLAAVDAERPLRYMPRPTTLRSTKASAGSVLAGYHPAPNVVVYNVFDAPNNLVPGFGAGIPYDERFITVDTTYADGPTGTNLDIGGAALTLVWSLAALEIKSITAYRATSGEFFRDPDNSPLVITHTSTRTTMRRFTEEFTFAGEMGRLEYVAGLFYLTEEGTDSSVSSCRLPRRSASSPTWPTSTTTARPSMDSDLARTDRWRVTGGLRYTKDDKTFTPFQRILFRCRRAAGRFGAADTDETVDASFDQTTGRLAFEFEPNDATLYYASFTKASRAADSTSATSCRATRRWPSIRRPSTHARPVSSSRRPRIACA